MRARFSFALVVLGAVVGAGAVAATEQAVVPLTPPVEQRVESIGSADEQRVAPVGAGVEQVIAAHEPPTPSQKAASTAGKIALGITAAVVALGAMAASLLLL